MVLLFPPRILIITIIPTILEQVPSIHNTLHTIEQLNHLFLHLLLVALRAIGLYHNLILNHLLVPTTPILTRLLCLYDLPTPLAHHFSHLVPPLLLVPLLLLLATPPLLLATPPLLLVTPLLLDTLAILSMHLENQNLVILMLTYFLILLITELNNNVLKITFQYL